VDELAEVLAVDYEDEEGIPRLNPNWRWDDQEQALLTSCSSLISIVESSGSRVVQFAHFSVKEYLTSARLATSSGDILRYHISLEPAHTILAQACMGTLLRSDDPIEQNGVKNNSQLAEYAAEHWVAHAKYENVSSYLRKAMEYLFDLDKPYFAAWQQLHDIDINSAGDSAFFQFTPLEKSDAVPLYYAALCGFQDLVGHLILKNPQHVNASGGYYVTPLVAALSGKHFQTARILHNNGAHPNVRGHENTTPLHAAAYQEDLQMVQVLLEYMADLNSRTNYGETPLHFLSNEFGTNSSSLSQLHNISRSLLEQGADINARDNDRATPLHAAAENGRVEVVRVLLEHRADINALNFDQSTPLHIAVQQGEVEVVRVLLDNRADVNARSKRHSTSLHRAARRGTVEVVRVLLEHGASVGAEDVDGRTPFRIASTEGHSDIVELLSKHGAK
jgi:ankyrin repeat protein